MKLDESPKEIIIIIIIIKRIRKVKEKNKMITYI